MRLFAFIQLPWVLRDDCIDQGAKGFWKSIEKKCFGFQEGLLAASHAHRERQDRFCRRASEWEGRVALLIGWRSNGRGWPVEIHKIGSGLWVDSRKLEFTERAESPCISLLCDSAQFQRPVTFPPQQ